LVVLLRVWTLVTRVWTVHWWNWGRERQLLGLSQERVELLHLAAAHCHFLV